MLTLALCERLTQHGLLHLAIDRLEDAVEKLGICGPRETLLVRFKLGLIRNHGPRPRTESLDLTLKGFSTREHLGDFLGLWVFVNDGSVLVPLKLKGRHVLRQRTHSFRDRLL